MAGALDSTIYGIWYHLGVVQYLRGDFAQAAASFAKAQPIAPDAGELAGSTDWLWMSLSRAGRGAEAKAMLDRRPDSKPVTNAYTRRLQLYRGEIGPDAVITPTDTDDVQVATLAYGLGNWYLVRGDKAQARRWFERSVQSGGWPAFGFVASEVELRRLTGQTAERTDAVLAHRLDAVIPRFLEVTGTPSVSVAVLRDGATIVARAWGLAQVESRRPATPEMRYAIGSVTKQFCAAALLLLQEDGKLSLDDRVARHLPDVPRAGQVTIRQLLNHTAGYDDYWPQTYLPHYLLKPAKRKRCSRAARGRKSVSA